MRSWRKSGLCDTRADGCDAEQDLVPSFPDLAFNADFLTTTGLDDCCHVEIQARPAPFCGAHSHR